MKRFPTKHDAITAFCTCLQPPLCTGDWQILAPMPEKKQRVRKTRLRELAGGQGSSDGALGLPHHGRRTARPGAT